MPVSREFALKALGLDNNLAEAHSALGAILEKYNYDFAGAEREYKKAIETKPELRDCTSMVRRANLTDDLRFRELLQKVAFPQ